VLCTLYKVLLPQLYPVLYKEAVREMDAKIQEMKKKHGKDWKNGINSAPSRR
jgi:hypothetical protein